MTNQNFWVSDHAGQTGNVQANKAGSKYDLLDQYGISVFLQHTEL